MSTPPRRQRLHISVRAEGLKNVAGPIKKRGRIGSTSDPYAIIAVNGGPHDGRSIGRTETIRNTLSPDWAETFVVDYWKTGTYFPITVSVYDDNDKKLHGDYPTVTLQALAESTSSSSAPFKTLLASRQPISIAPGGKDQYMGEASFELSEVMLSPGNERWIEVQSFGGRVYLHVDAPVFPSSPSAPIPGRSSLGLQFRALDLKNTESGLLGLGKTDPFITISKKLVDHSSGITRWKPVYRSRHLNDILNPLWDPFVLDMEILCNCDVEWPLQLTVMDYNRDGSHNLVGSVEFTPSAIIRHVSVRGNNADRTNAFRLSTEEKSSCGLLCVLAAEVNQIWDS